MATYGLQGPGHSKMVSGKMRFGKPVVFPNDTNISDISGWWYTNPSEKI